MLTSNRWTLLWQVYHIILFDHLPFPRNFQRNLDSYRHPLLLTLPPCSLISYFTLEFTKNEREEKIINLLKTNQISLQYIYIYNKKKEPHELTVGLIVIFELKWSCLFVQWVKWFGYGNIVMIQWVTLFYVMIIKLS